jgi:outer membrane protein TolC
MKNILITVLTMALVSTLFAQNSIENVLVEIEKNNTTLSALKEKAEASKLGNKTGIYLQNPEVEFNYLWSDAITGNRKDFSIKQTFDFPTAYKFKNQISNIKNEQVGLEYQKQRKELLLEARLICLNIVYSNALHFELSNRLTNAERIANSYKAKLDAGESNILEYNKAQLNLLNLNKELESLNIEKEALQGELSGLNGGITIVVSDSIFQPGEIPVDFEQWYLQAEQSNPLLNWLKKEIELSQKQKVLNKSMSLPKFQAGYMSESVVAQDFKGITIGLSIPLWENKNTVKYSELNTLAMEEAATDNKIQMYNHLKVLHVKAIRLQKNVSDYKQNLKLLNNSELLAKALDKGEISLIEYMLELSVYYESLNKLLQKELELSKTVAELNKYL